MGHVDGKTKRAGRRLGEDYLALLAHLHPTLGRLLDREAEIPSGHVLAALVAGVTPDRDANWLLPPGRRLLFPTGVAIFLESLLPGSHLHFPAKSIGLLKKRVDWRWKRGRTKLARRRRRSTPSSIRLVTSAVVGDKACPFRMGS